VWRLPTICLNLKEQRTINCGLAGAFCAISGSGIVADRLHRLLHGRVSHQLRVKANALHVVFNGDTLIGSMDAGQIGICEPHGDEPIGVVGNVLKVAAVRCTEHHAGRYRDIRKDLSDGLYESRK